MKRISGLQSGQIQQSPSSDLKVNYLDKNLSSEQKYKLSLRIAQSYQKLKRYREAKTIYQKCLRITKMNVCKRKSKAGSKNWKRSIRETLEMFHVKHLIQFLLK